MLTAAIMFFASRRSIWARRFKTKTEMKNHLCFLFYKICISRFTETYFAFLTSSVCAVTKKSVYHFQ